MNSLKFLLLLCLSSAFALAATPTRPKDLTPASAPASDDKVVLDGTTNGTRALDANYWAARANHTGQQPMSTISDAGTAATKNVGTLSTEVAAGDAPAAAQAAAIAASLPASYLDTDQTAAADSDTKVMSQKATRAYVAANSASSFGALSGNATDNASLLAALDLKKDVAPAINAQTGTTYTIAAADTAKDLTLNNAAAITVTVPTDATVPIPVRSTIRVNNIGAGAATLVAAGGVTITNINGTAVLPGSGRWGILLKTAADTWEFRVEPYFVSTTTDPGVNDDSGDGHQAFDIWTNTSSGVVWICTSNTTGAATWSQLGGLAGGSGQLSVTFEAENGAISLTDMASALSWIKGNVMVIKKDLTNFTQCRLTVYQASGSAASGSKIILRYRTTYSGTVTDYSDIGSSEVSTAFNTAGNDALATSWINLVAGAKADVYLAVMCSGGDGAADPSLRIISADFK